MAATLARTARSAAQIRQANAGRQIRRDLSTAPPLPDWAKLGFAATPTKAMIRYDWEGKKWNSGSSSPNFNVTIHGLSNVLHYGQGLFEGLKAFHCKDGKVSFSLRRDAPQLPQHVLATGTHTPRPTSSRPQVRVFNSKSNAARLQRGAQRLAMPVVPPELFEEAVDRTIRDNVDYIPPYGYGGAMYLRPFLFGHGEKLGLGAAPHYSFCIIASPVGAYYKGGLQPIDALVIQEFDRAAPRGVGGIKCAGNYAPDVLPSIMAKERGFPVCLYLDAATQVRSLRPPPKTAGRVCLLLLINHSRTLSGSALRGGGSLCPPEPG
jgi:branched-chain amino acid aminotransferase